MNLTTTRYMGLTLKNPLVASASPLSQSLDTIRRLEDNGAAAIVMFSLFEEQIRHDLSAMEHFMSVGTDSYGEALSYFPAVDDFDVGPAQYLELVRKASAGRRYPDHRQSERRRRERGWVDFRDADAGRRREGHRAEHLLHPDRDVPHRGRSRGAVRGRLSRACRASGARFRSPSRSGRTSARSRIWRDASKRPAPTRWCSSTASTSPISTSRREPWFRRWR